MALSVKLFGPFGAVNVHDTRGEPAPVRLPPAPRPVQTSPAAPPPPIAPPPPGSIALPTTRPPTAVPGVVVPSCRPSGGVRPDGSIVTQLDYDNCRKGVTTQTPTNCMGGAPGSVIFDPVSGKTGVCRADNSIDWNPKAPPPIVLAPPKPPTTMYPAGSCVYDNRTTPPRTGVANGDGTVNWGATCHSLAPPIAPNPLPVVPANPGGGGPGPMQPAPPTPIPEPYTISACSEAAKADAQARGPDFLNLYLQVCPNPIYQQAPPVSSNPPQGNVGPVAPSNDGNYFPYQPSQGNPYSGIDPTQYPPFPATSYPGQMPIGGKYPGTAVARWNKTRKTYAIYDSAQAGLAGWGDDPGIYPMRTVLGGGGGFGDSVYAIEGTDTPSEGAKNGLVAAAIGLGAALLGGAAAVWALRE